MKIFSKITSNGYNNSLEKILEDKPFDEKVKNLLLSMLYKIENGYNDYMKVKFDAIEKDEFIERLLKIIQDQCFEIDVVTPKTELSKPLENDNVVCKVDETKGSILVYENEEDLLYSLIKMELLQKNYSTKVHNETYYEKALKGFLQKGTCINESEIIRDFDGWSWNNSIKRIDNIQYNAVFQNIKMLNINVDELKNKFEQNIADGHLFEKNVYIMILTLESQANEEIRLEVKSKYTELFKWVELMKNKTAFLEEITQKKKQISNDIKIIDETINDKTKLRKEYDYRNSKLKNRDKIFSVSYLIDILGKERKLKLEELKEMNGFLDPRKFGTQKQKMENELSILNNVMKNLASNEEKEKSIINLQKEFLKEYEKHIEQKMNNKDQIEHVIYQFRYYCLLPIISNKCIHDISELQEQIEKVINIIIDNAIDREIITNFSNSASLCYSILKYIFITKIIDLKEIKIKINKIKEVKYVNETQYHVGIIICDAKEAENIYNEIIYNLKLLNVRLNKKIPLFIK